MRPSLSAILVTGSTDHPKATPDPHTVYSKCCGVDPGFLTVQIVSVHRTGSGTWLPMDDAHRFAAQHLNDVLRNYYAGQLTVDEAADQLFAIIQQLKSSAELHDFAELADRLAGLTAAPADSPRADVVLGPQASSSARATAAEALNQALQRRARQ